MESHRQAWLDLRQIADDYPDLRGEMHDLFDIMTEGRDSVRFEALIHVVWDTWTVVEAEALAVSMPD